MVGAIAPTAEAYTLFRDLYDPIIYEYHGYNIFNSHTTTLNASEAANLEGLKVDDENLFY